MGSNVEDILRATIDGTEYTEPPKSRVESLLVELKETIEEGGGGGGSDTPQFIQIKMTATSYTPGGDVIHISASGVSDLLSVDVSSYYSKLNGYSFHSMSIVDYVPSAYDDPDPPDIRPILSQACYDPSEREVRAWVFKAGETDLALYLKSIDVSILFVKDSE